MAWRAEKSRIFHEAIAIIDMDSQPWRNIAEIYGGPNAERIVALVLAAEELLAACKEIMEFTVRLEAEGELNWTIDDSTIFNRAKAAIAKATTPLELEGTP